MNRPVIGNAFYFSWKYLYDKNLFELMLNDMFPNEKPLSSQRIRFNAYSFQPLGQMPIGKNMLTSSHTLTDPGSPRQRMIRVSFITEKQRSFRFHETILRLGEPGSLGSHMTSPISSWLHSNQELQRRHMAAAIASQVESLGPRDQNCKEAIISEKNIPRWWFHVFF